VSTPTRFFCTYFDSRYLSRGRAMYESLQTHGGTIRLFVLCLDEETHAAMAPLPDVRAIRLTDLEGTWPELVAARSGRSLLEYYYTCTPALLAFVFAQHPDVHLLTYLDADLFFFASPEPLFAELGDGDIGIIEHRFPPELQRLEEYGRFNVGWVTLRRAASALGCLERWRAQCLEWCYDRVEPERFGDQKYLDAWPGLHEGVVVLRHKGANVAPWNVGRYTLRQAVDQVFVDEATLLFYHFHGLHYVRPGPFRSGLAPYATVPTPVLRRHVYRPYLRELMRHDREAGYSPRRNRNP
jgi:hypothetical protein